MSLDITTGNTVTDGRDFRFWIVGCLEKWCAENNVPFDAERFGLRSSSDIEVKWGIYKNGDARTVWASCSDKTAMSILVRGDSTFHFRDPAQPDEIREVRMFSEGDYVIWKEDVEHTWRMDEDSVFVTLRWQAGSE